MIPTKHITNKSVLLLIVVSLLFLSSGLASFTETVDTSLSLNQTSSISNGVWKYTELNKEYYLILQKNDDDTVSIALRNPGSYLYFGRLIRNGTVYQLNEPHWNFDDIELEIEMTSNKIILNAISEKLKIDFKDAVFAKTLVYPLAEVLVAKVEEGEDWFVSDAFITRLGRGETIYTEVNEDIDLLNNLSVEDRADYDLFIKYISVYPWQTQGDGCSWYCGVMDFRTEASSMLDPIGDIKYSSSNVHDYSLLTAWVEGETGDGIGESVTISFKSGNPRATQILVYNGYQKSKEAYYSNGRAKVLTLFINDIEYGILQLEDSPRPQQFNIELTTVLNSDDELQFKFRIDEVYRGELYQDTAISEINFNGVDVH